MNTKSIFVAAVSLAIGVVVGWIAKPAPVATATTGHQRTHQHKSRVAESKVRVKTVTAVVTNMVHDIVTNMVEVVRDRPQGIDGWREEMERLKEEDPAEYAARTNRMANFRNQMLQRAEGRLQTLASVDTTGWSKRQLETHERYQELIAQREELMELLRPDSGATGQQRKEAIEQMRDVMKELHKTGNAERNILLDKTLSSLGYKGSAAAEVKEALNTIYSTTQDWGGLGGFGGQHHHRHNRNGPPPR